MKKINIKRTRPDRSDHRRLALGETVGLTIRISAADKRLLVEEAQKNKLSLSLYLNLILHGQEKSPLL